MFRILFTFRNVSFLNHSIEGIKNKRRSYTIVRLIQYNDYEEIMSIRRNSNEKCIISLCVVMEARLCPPPHSSDQGKAGRSRCLKRYRVARGDRTTCLYLACLARLWLSAFALRASRSIAHPLGHPRPPRRRPLSIMGGHDRCHGKVENNVSSFLFLLSCLHKER